MKNYIRKMWLYIVMCFTLILATFTSTYAYYAINYLNETEEFNFDIESGDELLISTDGINFKKELSDIEVKEAILNKRGVDTSNLSDEEILNLFDIVLLDISPNDITNIENGFMSIDGDSITPYNYISFDIYLSSNIIDESDMPLGMPVFIGKETSFLSNDIEVDLTDYELEESPILGKVNKPIKMNLENACRMSITTHDMCAVGDVSNASLNPITTIYSMGGNTPHINDYGVYNFGGINSGYNLAQKLYNQILDTNIVLPNREDIPLNCNKVINEDEGLVEGQMKKLTVYLWLEGWDSDCINQMGGQAATFNLSFANYYG